MLKPNFSNVPKTSLEVAKYLRSSSSNLKVRQGVLNGRRVDFFKGKHAVNAVLRDSYAKYSKTLPSLEDRFAAEKLIAELHQHGFFLRVEKPPKSKTLGLQPIQVWSQDAYYIWVYEGNQWWGTLMGLGVMILTLAGVMFPLWPNFMRLGVYYLSLAFLGLMGLFMGLVVVRFFVWLITVLAVGRGFLIFPNLLADVGIIESFIPTFGWEEKKSETKSSSKSGKAKDSDAEGDGDDGDGGADD